MSRLTFSRKNSCREVVDREMTESIPLTYVKQRDGRETELSTAPDGLRYRVVEMDDLVEADINRWLELRASNPALDSPYFHPAFTAAVAASRSDVRVIVGEQRCGAKSSFLPVQFEGRSCRPVGYPAADFQGPICARLSPFDVAAAIRAAGASSYHFDHMREGIAEFEPWTFGREESPYVDVSGGMTGYLSRASRTGKENIRKAGRLSRKAERDYGPVRFVAESADIALLDAVIALKRRQYRETGSRDYFSDARHIHLLHRLFETRGVAFGGVLSAVYAGQHLLAAHFGLRAGSILHWWFPVYDSDFARLSPGWLLLRALIDSAPELGLERIDLGRGADEYKRRVMTGYQVVCQGEVCLNPLRHRAASARRTALGLVKSSRVAPPVRRAIRQARRRARALP